MSNSRYRRLLRTLLLPINIKLEEACVEKLKQVLNVEAGNEYQEHQYWLNSLVSEWEESRLPPKKLENLITDLLDEGNSDYREAISNSYFDAHKELIINQLLTFDLARSFLSHLLFIVRLSDEEKMSCAQISVILHAMNPSAGFGRRSIEAILGKMKMAPAISVENISNLIDSDKEFLVDAFGDSEFTECIIKVSNVAKSLGFKNNLEEHLNILANEEDITRYTPYVQILHYQCSILEYYDHLVKDFYEFSPRGIAALYLFDSYPSSMVNARNPFLNNAKSVAQIDLPWVAAKKNREFAGAAALFAILDGFDEMGYATSKELAQWIRCLIHRFMIAVEPLITPLPEKLSLEQYKSVFEKVAESNTATKGIIEQRVVDALITQIHRNEDGWILRGIGDSVNTSNLSKKKLGDCDVQNIEKRLAVAYEAHGGTLTEAYVNEHLKTLHKLVIPRLDEWRSFSDISEWKVEIIFVAHFFSTHIPPDMEIEGVKFKFKFINYNDLVNQIELESSLEVLERLILKPLSKRKTPSFVRQAFIQFIA